MANDCFTMYRLYGDKKLAQDIKRVQARHKDEYPNWCKWLATDLLGYSEEDIKQDKIYVRGQIIDIYDDITDDEIMIDTDTAWHPCTQLFDKLAHKYDLDIYWMADERGCVGIWSNDVEHVVWDWEYNVYIEETGAEEYFSSEEDALEFINDYLKDVNHHPITSISQADEIDEIYVTEIEYAENF